MEENLNQDSGGAALLNNVVADQKVNESLTRDKSEGDDSVNKNLGVEQLKEAKSKESSDSSAPAVSKSAPSLHAVSEEREAQNDVVSLSADGDLQSANISTTSMEQRTSKRLASKQVPKNPLEPSSVVRKTSRGARGLPPAIPEPPWKSGTPRFTYSRKPTKTAVPVIGAMNSASGDRADQGSPTMMDVCMFPNELFENPEDNTEELLLPDISSPHDSDTEVVDETKENVLDCDIPIGSSDAVPVVTIKEEISEDLLDSSSPSTSRISNAKTVEETKKKASNCDKPLGSSDAVPSITIKKEIIDDFHDYCTPSTSRSSVPNREELLIPDVNPSPSHSDTEMLEEEETKEVVLDCDVSDDDSRMSHDASDAGVSVKEDEESLDEDDVVTAMKEEMCEAVLKNCSPSQSTNSPEPAVEDSTGNKEDEAEEAPPQNTYNTRNRKRQRLQPPPKTKTKSKRTAKDAEDDASTDGNSESEASSYEMSSESEDEDIDQDDEKIPERKFGICHIEEIFSCITDEHASNSDFGGDTDAEDNVCETYDDSDNEDTNFDNYHNDKFTPDGQNVNPVYLDAGGFCSVGSEVVIGADCSEQAFPSSECRNVGNRHYNSPFRGTDVSKKAFAWSKCGNPGKLYDNSPFDEPVGATQIIDEKSTAEVYFERFFTDNVLQSIVEQTNKYSAEIRADFETNVQELKAFIGILIIMGFHQLPTIRSYWSMDQNLYVHRIAKLLTRKRFLNLVRTLHLNDNSKMPKRGTPEFDRLYKIRPLLNSLTESFSTNFKSHRSVTISESSFRGSSINPVKPCYKVWMMACSTSGYMLAFHVYCGTQDDRANPSLDLGERVILELSSSLEGHGYCLFFDSFFTRFPLMLHLLEKKLFACGSVRQNVKFFPMSHLSPDKNLAKGEWDFVTTEKVCCVKWKDRGRKALSIVSTMHDPRRVATVVRTDEKGKKENLTCPQAVSDYNSCMGGVDKFDQLRETYCIRLKSKRWWMKLFYFFLNAAIVNSYIMYQELAKQKNLKPISHLCFRSELANELIGTYCQRKKSGPTHSHGGWARKLGLPGGRRTALDSLRLFNVGDHIPHRGTSRRCAHCSTKDKQVRSRTICSACDVALCVPCWEPFHRA